MKRIIIDGSEIEVLDYAWREELPIGFNYYGKLELLPFTIDYIKVKIARQNCKELLKKILPANECVIEADNKKAKFYIDWYKQIESGEIEIQFIGTCNEVD